MSMLERPGHAICALGNFCLAVTVSRYSYHVVVKNMEGIDHRVDAYKFLTTIFAETVVGISTVFIGKTMIQIADVGDLRILEIDFTIFLN